MIHLHRAAIMKQFSLLPHLLAVSVLLLSTPSASAWTPSTQPPVGEGDGSPSMPAMPSYPLPDHPGYSSAPPLGYGPPAYPYPSMPYGTPPGSAPEGGPAISRGVPGASDIDGARGSVALNFAGMRLTQQRSDDAYTLDIELGGADPSQVRIEPIGSALVIISEQSAESRREETFADGRGFSRSFSYASGRSTKRLPVPPDGDLSAMQREDSDGHIRILIPRVAMTSPTPQPAPQGPATPVPPPPEQQ
jgi:HSP20 family molecular chaperone IbpA